MAFEQRQHALRVRLRCSVRKRHNGNLDAIHARINRRQITRRTQPGRVVRVQRDRNADLALQLFHHPIGDLRLNDAGHVFDADGVAAHLLQLDTHLHEVLDRVDRANRIAQLAARVLAIFFCGLDGGLQISHVVQRVKNAEDVLSVLAREAHESFHDVIGKARVLNDVLSAQQHELRCLRRDLLQRAQAVERIFVQVAETGVNRRAAPGLQAGESHLVENGRRFEHGGGRHAGGRHGLMTITKNGVVEKDRFRIHKSCIQLSVGGNNPKGKLAWLGLRVPCEASRPTRDAWHPAFSCASLCSSKAPSFAKRNLSFIRQILWHLPAQGKDCPKRCRSFPGQIWSCR